MNDKVGNKQYSSDNHLHLQDSSTSTSTQIQAQEYPSDISGDNDNPLPTRANRNKDRQGRTTTHSPGAAIASEPSPSTPISKTKPARRSTRLSLAGVATQEHSQPVVASTSTSSAKGKKRAHIDETPTVIDRKKKPRTSLAISNTEPTTDQDSPFQIDRKGKKRAARSPTPPVIEPSPATKFKRARRSSGISSSGRYDLRSKLEDEQPDESTVSKGKGKAPAASKGKRTTKDMPKKPAAIKPKKIGAGGPSIDRSKKGDTSARVLVDDGMDEDDSLWMDEPGASNARSRLMEDDDEDDGMEGSDHDEEDDDDEEGDDHGDDGAENSGGLAGSSGRLQMDRLAQLAADSGLNLDEATAAALFGRGFGMFGGMMSGNSNRFKRLKNNLQSRSAATRLNALRECSELLLVSNEDTLGSSFSPTNFATEFIAILNGKPNINNDGSSDEEPPALDEMDEDAQLAAALALSAGNTMPMPGSNTEDAMESQLLACRCLAHLMEALPGTGHTLVHLGAIPVLCSKLTEISYIELAEQTLSTLEKISAEYGAAIPREGSLGALLNYLPFFSTNVQRTAVTAAANCCKNLSGEHYKQIKEVFPTLRDTLGSGDQRLVEQATLAVVRTIESYRHNAEYLEGLLDLPTVAALNSLLIPSGGSPLISPSTYTSLLKALTNSARGAAKVSILFLEAGMTNTIYQILTGVLPPSHDEDEQGESSGGQGLAGGVADMAVLQNLAHRPKDQVEEALALICEMLPPVPKDGVFDQKAYTEKSLSRLKKGRKSDRSDKSERGPRRSSRVAEAAASSSGSADPATPTANAVPLPTTGDTNAPTPIGQLSAHHANILKAKKEADALMAQRLELLAANPELLGKFIKAVVPVLVDVYAASVVLRVRTKVLTGLVKAVAFAEPDALKATLKSVPMASFLCAIIASKDNPIFVLHALQLVELLVTKLPDVYQASFLREGVVFEIEALAKQETAKEITAKEAKEAAAVKTEPEDVSTPVAGPSSSSALPPVPDDMKPFLSLANMPSGFTVLGDLSSNPTTPKKSSSFIDPIEANIIRARILRAKRVFHLAGDHHHAATQVLDEISAMVQKLCKPDASEAELRDTLRQVASKFGNVEQALSSFELLKSGLVDGLLQYVDIDGAVSSSDRRAMLFETFSDTTLANPNPLTMLVKRLHESLGRLEDFEVETAFGGGSDPTRPNGSSLARTLRIKLQAEEGQDIPKPVQQLSITIQAIAPMQALHDYLRPRVADGNYGSGLSRMFAAYASGMPMGGGAGSGTSRLLSALAASSTGGPSGSGGSIFGAPAPPSASGLKPSGSGGPAENEANVQAGSSSTPVTGNKSPKVQRRRSARLSAQGLIDSPNAAPSASVPTTAPPVVAETAPLSSSAPEPTILPAMPMDMDFDDDYSDEDYDAEVFDEEMEEEIIRPTERVVNMSVAADGSRVEAKTPEGTRIATPQQNPLAGSAVATAGPSGSGTLTPRTASYAGAVKTAPANWHLEFFVNGNKLSLEDTIYGAVHRNNTAASGPAAANVFNMPVVIKFKKVDGPADAKAPLDAPSPASVTSAMPAALDPSTPTSKVLRLLRVVHNLTADARDLVGLTTTQLDENLFVNNKLTAKLTRQLEETMILASHCLPEWAVELPKHFSFLFPFDTRYAFLQSTSFGYGRLISRSQAGQNSRNTHRRDDISHLARLVRQKVRISRSQLLESCAKVLELYGTSNGILEVEYFDEIGTGLGPTLEFYSLASKEFARRALKIWRDEDESKEGEFVFHPKGLFPSPMIVPTADQPPASTAGSRLSWYTILGLFTGRALLDSRIIDVNLNKVFLKLILGHPIKKNIATLKSVDLALARSLERLQAYLHARKEIEALKLPASSRRNKLAALTVHGAKLADLSLDFTLPGYNIELKPGGAHIDVDDSNLEEYLEKVLDMTLGSGVAQQVKAFQEGFSMIFPIKDMQVFSPEELGLLFGNTDEDWSRETLEQALKADHGYNLDSRAVQNLIEVMVEYDKEQRRAFLQFITGAPKLPIGGFRGLTPPFTVVRKPHEPPFRADDYLPSVMTCAQYLKMPDYSTKEVLAAQLSRAMQDGGGSFHLS